MSVVQVKLIHVSMPSVTRMLTVLHTRRPTSVSASQAMKAQAAGARVRRSTEYSAQV